MIGITNKRAAVMAGTTAAIAVILLAIALAASTESWSPKCRYPFGGTWIGILEVHPNAWTITEEVPLDITGKRESSASWVQTGDPPQDFDPETVAFFGNCRNIATGKYTFEQSGVFYFINETTHTKYIFLSYAEFRWIDRDHREYESWYEMYLAMQDANGDGLPDPGQEPMWRSDVINGYEYRLPWFDIPRPE